MRFWVRVPVLSVIMYLICPSYSFMLLVWTSAAWPLEEHRGSFARSIPCPYRTISTVTTRLMGMKLEKLMNQLPHVKNTLAATLPLTPTYPRLSSSELYRIPKATALLEVIIT